MTTETYVVTTYNLVEAAAKVGVTRQTIWRDINAGKLRAQRKSNRVTITADDLLDYVLQHRRGDGIPSA